MPRSMSGRLSSSLALSITVAFLASCGGEPGLSARRSSLVELLEGDLTASRRNSPETEERPASRRPTADDLPALLSELAQFSDPRSLAPNVGVRPYEVRHALWSDGAVKHRTLRLPPGARIELGEAGHWIFPDETVATKTFVHPDRATAADGAKIETRVLRKRAGAWQFAAYIWNEGGTDAVRTGDSDVALSFNLPGVDGDYVVPGRVACIQCHGGVEDRIIGFSAVQIDDRTLEDLRDAAIVDDEVLRDRDYAARNEVEREALGYLDANCAHCHNPLSPAYDGDELDLRPQHALAETIGIEPERLVHAEAPALISPGDPRRSVLYRLFERTYTTQHDSDREKRMPPIGNAAVDPDGIQLLSRWIRDLDGAEQGQ